MPIGGSQLEGVAYIELYVRDRAGRIDYFTRGLDFVAVAEARLPSAVSTLLRCGTAQIVVTSPSSEGSYVASWLRQHGEGVAELGLYHEKVVLAATRAEAAGLTLYRPAEVSPEGHWTTTIAGIGSVRHTLIELKNADAGVVPLGFPWRWRPESTGTSGHIDAVDHVEICIPEGSLEVACQFYGGVLGLTEFFKEQVRLRQHRVNMSGFRDRSGGLRLLLNASEYGDCGPVASYLRAHHNLPAVRRIALSSPRIIDACHCYRERGVGFEIVPSCYYDLIAQRLDDFPGGLVRLQQIRDAGLLVAEDYGGLLYQGVIRSPYRRRDMLTFELIHRDGAFGFGTGSQFNLWEAEEAELATMEAALRSS